jgi:hypothetical protein
VLSWVFLFLRLSCFRRLSEARPDCF